MAQLLTVNLGFLSGWAISLSASAYDLEMITAAKLPLSLPPLHVSPFHRKASWTFSFISLLEKLLETSKKDSLVEGEVLEQYEGKEITWK